MNTFDNNRVRGKMRMGLVMMEESYPFYGALLALWKPCPKAGISTMAVGSFHHQLHLYYNPDFVEELSLDELRGVLVHEILHILFGHISMKPEQYPNEGALTIAQEITVNEFVAEPLPGEPITLKDYPFLPPGESTEQRYQRLEEIFPKGHPVPKPFDDHSLWQGDGNCDEDHRDLQEMFIQEDIAAASRQIAPEELSKLPDPVREKVEAIKQSHGMINIAGGFGEHLNPAGDKLSWKRLLQRMVGRELEGQFRFYRPPRRFPHLVGIVPARTWCSSKPHIMVVIDTSGSIASAALNQISGELEKMARSFSITVVECDSKIQKVYPYQQPIQSVQGRGGTSFLPPLEKEFLARQKSDVVIYFTDGYGEAPATKTGVPVFWCLAPGGRIPAPWGRVVWMEEGGGFEDNFSDLKFAFLWIKWL